MRPSIELAILSAFAFAGCVGAIDGTGSGDDGPDPDPVVCEQTRSYAGFGGALEGDRPQIEGGSDRMRVKPFGALAAEYQRALGLATFNTGAYAATFGRPPPRWYNEPSASANTVYAAFALAYDACTRKTSAGSQFASAPDTLTAGQLCREFARGAWQREATEAETAACVTYAVDKTSPADAPAKRWAYACAAVLSASDFVAY